MNSAESSGHGWKHSHSTVEWLKQLQQDHTLHVCAHDYFGLWRARMKNIKAQKKRLKERFNAYQKILKVYWTWSMQGGKAVQCMAVQCMAVAVCMAVQCLPLFEVIDTVIENSLFFLCFSLWNLPLSMKNVKDSRESYQYVGERRFKR